MSNLAILQKWSEIDCDTSNLDELENNLYLLERDLSSELDTLLTDLDSLQEARQQIGNPASIGQVVKDVVWEQFLNQIAVVAGEDFIKENRGRALDLRNSAHIQTTENFAQGRIASHNDSIDYQSRYDNWQSNFQHDESGNVIMHQTRTGKEDETLVKGARRPFDSGRPSGSAERGTDMDHTVSAGEIIRDPAANAHMSREEQIAFANSEVNLLEMPSGQNRSKGDLSTTDWLDTPNRRGQKPQEIFDISDEQEQLYRQRDAEARAEFSQLESAAEQRSIDTGLQSQKAEAMRITGKAGRAIMMSLLAGLLKDVINKLVAWFKSSNKKFSTFINSIQEAFKSFFSKIKEHLKNACNTALTTIATAIINPICGVIKKTWVLLKQGYKSIKDAIKFLKNPANKEMPFSIKMLEVGKIIIAGLTTGSAIVLSEVFEKALLHIPGFAFEIPLLGSLANIIGMFSAAIVSGLIGALALNFIDRLIAKRLKKENSIQQFDKKNEIIQAQEQLVVVSEAQVVVKKAQVASEIVQRHIEVGDQFQATTEIIDQNAEESERLHTSSAQTNADITDLLNSL